eukprot:11522703-Prorocentrum_lima.AAC.1
MREQSGLNTVCGVGGSSTAVRAKAKVPIGSEGLGDLSFEGSVLDNSEVPALLGLRTIEALHGIIDTKGAEDVRL